MKSKSLTTVCIERRNDIDDDGRHDEITIYTGLEIAADDNDLFARYGNPSEDEWREALAYLRGVFGRLIAEAHEWIACSRQEHGCRGERFRATAGIRSAVVDVADPTADNIDRVGDVCHASSWDLIRDRQGVGGVYPRAYLYVPSKDAKVWIARVQFWLAEIEATDWPDEDPS